MTERKPRKSQGRSTNEAGQDPDAVTLLTSRGSGPITYRLEVVAVPGKEGEALFKNQQAATLNALRWAAANTPESDNLARSGVVEQTRNADGMIIAVDPRPLTQREQAVLEALLAIDFQGAENLRRQTANVVIVGRCNCGCPSIDFQYQQGLGMSVRVNATVRDSYDGLFLFTVEDSKQGEVLGGIEWVGVGQANPDELPPPELLDIQPA